MGPVRSVCTLFFGPVSSLRSFSLVRGQKESVRSFGDARKLAAQDERRFGYRRQDRLGKKFFRSSQLLYLVSFLLPCRFQAFSISCDTVSFTSIIPVFNGWIAVTFMDKRNKFSPGATEGQQPRRVRDTRSKGR